MLMLLSVHVTDILFLFGVTRCYSSRPFLCTLVILTCTVCQWCGSDSFNMQNSPPFHILGESERINKPGAPPVSCAHSMRLSQTSLLNFSLVPRFQRSPEPEH